MLHFVRIDHENELEDHTWFSFYCTVMDDFVWFNNTQIFKSYDHFVESYNDRKEDEENRDIHRFLKIIPENQ